MIRNAYNSHWKPPAPFVLITLTNTLTGAEVRDFPAQVDSAADRTVLPQGVVNSLRLDVSGLIQIVGVGGTVQELSLYPVSLAMHQLPPQIVEVVGHANERWALLGRDVLNAYRVILDGPNLILEIA